VIACRRRAGDTLGRVARGVSPAPQRYGHPRRHPDPVL